MRRRQFLATGAVFLPFVAGCVRPPVVDRVRDHAGIAVSDSYGTRLLA